MKFRLVFLHILLLVLFSKGQQQENEQQTLNNIEKDKPKEVSETQSYDTSTQNSELDQHDTSAEAVAQYQVDDESDNELAVEQRKTEENQDEVNAEPVALDEPTKQAVVVDSFETSDGEKGDKKIQEPYTDALEEAAQPLMTDMGHFEYDEDDVGEIVDTGNVVTSVGREKTPTENTQDESNQQQDASSHPNVNQGHTISNQQQQTTKTISSQTVVTPTPTPAPQKELTQEEKEAAEKQKKLDDLYDAAMKKINSSNVRSIIIEGYQTLKNAASQGHANADVEIAFGLLSGIYMPMDLQGSKRIFEKHAEHGNPKAQAGLAFLYATGIGTNSSQAKALVYLTFSALGEDPMGRMMLGYRYWAGVGVTKNCEAALTFYRKVADEIAAKVSLTGGSMSTRIRLLDEDENPGNTYGRVDDDLVQYYQFLADKGDAPAQVTLGQLNYQGGRGFEQNRQRAFEYFERAAKSGNANAQGYLGKIYAEGSETVKQNNESAIRYFKLAADQGNPIGHAGLGLMYLHGKGVKVDYNKAFKHFQVSADQGWAEGQLHLGNMYFNAQGVSRDYKQASRLFNLAAQNGHLLALYYLAQMHSTGTGVVRSCRTAVELYKNVCERGRWAGQLDAAYSQYKAGKINSALSLYLLLAELGYEVAQSNVAYILDQDQATLLNQTYARALIHWDRAASQGYVVARIKLGDYHYYGKGTEVDYEVAANHYKEASDSSSSAQAYFNLGYMHEQGLGMKRDIHLAKRQYDMAAEASPDAAAPVALALIKLGFLYAIEAVQNQQWWHSSTSFHHVTASLPEEWDLYLITILALMLGFVIAFRRQQR
uniref:Protein sel-1 homolog 1-like n=1 Tax=Phallusia mammillata TaxID=59560 RepID=A0A6F9DSG5_9ASCI|nr:protein sel-1 homolog 1-like [Phallusia mammillata]